MPPWSSRLHPGPSTSSSNASRVNVSSIPVAERTVPIPINNDVPVVIPFETPHPSARRSHSRSISHPFPSLFGGGNRKNSKGVSKQDFLDSDDDDDIVTYAPDPRSSSPRKGSQRPEDASTGKCMTCDSTVKWPREVKVFRCTVCLTINDLEPHRDSGDAPHHGHSGRTEAPAAKGIHRKAIPISVERTKRIVDQCVSSYLQKRLDILESRLSSTGVNGQRYDTYPQSQTNGKLGAEVPGNQWLIAPDSQLSTSPKETWESSGDYLSPPKGYGDVRNGEGSRSHLSPYAADAERRHLRRKNRSSSDIPAVPGRNRSPRGAGHSANEASPRGPSDNRPLIFRPLEDYIISCFRGCECLNNSFSTARSSSQTTHEVPAQRVKTEQNPTSNSVLDPAMFEPDAKTLLLGDVAENSTWWLGHRVRRGDGNDAKRDRSPDPSRHGVSPRTPRIDWAELAEWYRAVISAGESWHEKWSMMTLGDTTADRRSSGSKRWDTMELDVIEREITEARLHTQRTLLKATESVLKRPRQPLKTPEDIRFILILLSNPLLYSSASFRRPSATPAPSSRPRGNSAYPPDDRSRGTAAPRRPRTSGPGNHSGIIKRIVGLISNLPNECHQYLVSWFSRFSEGQFQRTVDLVGGFVTYRLMRQHGKERSESSKEDNGLIPNLPGPIGNTAAQLHAALSGRNQQKQKNDDGPKPVLYGEDWQVKAAARTMSLLFAANNSNVPRRQEGAFADGRANAGLIARSNAQSRGQKIPISSFYNTLLDYSDLVADFEAWESRSGKFSFCQYAFFLSIWAKIHILEHDARRQMEVKAREAFFDSILSRKAVSQYLVLKVRRDCLVEDSLRGVSEVIGGGPEEVKKGLRIEFLGEEGVDAGGLRKEWFLLLVREVFDPNHGLFLYDEESQFCYFNPYCFESSEQFFLVGVLLGLAIYNSTILDIALPPFAFKKLLASAPPSNGPATSTSRSTYRCTLDDLEQYRPSLAKGLRGLLEYDGDVQETFCYDFVAQVDRYGEIVEIPLCPGGERKPVTNTNRREFVDLYVHYMLDTAIARQFEPFKRGFFTVCAGNALSLFRPEEIELLVRGSDEPLDVASLRAVANYDNWTNPRPENEPVVRWFWELFLDADAKAQRRLLSFITGSDRIPAMGATNLTIRISCLGDDVQRYPTARTCFNMLGLYRYPTKQKLAVKLWSAVENSEGFGLK
ncbi:putative E3 ubiquitin-protein ligase [Paecilomyces lecythidis]|uniref:HECT-type E3 ubiquitin transferase n=1 Tax=Paecilomyces lecythidis TaxID=3004212 RepID=A0ABR3Y1J6_9EURO